MTVLRPQVSELKQEGSELKQEVSELKQEWRIGWRGRKGAEGRV